MNKEREQSIAPTRVRTPRKGNNGLSDENQIIFGSWTREEDETIIEFIKVNGETKWTQLARLIGHRTGKQCRERWKNNLDPTVSKSKWTEEEDRLIIESIEKSGTRWSIIASLLPGRTDNAVKNRWYSTLHRRLERIARGEIPDKRRGRKPHQSISFDLPQPPLVADKSIYPMTQFRDEEMSDDVIPSLTPISIPPPEQWERMTYDFS